MSDPDRGIQGVQGIQGIQGVEGQSGGEPGKQGPPGKPGKTPVTWWQVVGVAAFVLVVFVFLAWRSDVNSDRIDANTDRLVENRYQGCLNGVRIIEKFNAQMQELADIERRNTGDPLAGARIKAYESGLTPLPNVPCTR